MEGFDLDDTLAKVEYNLAGIRGLANIFRSAKLMYAPRDPFIIVTARPHATNAEKNATIDWLKENTPNYLGVYYVNGTEDEIATAKAGYIRRRNLTAWTDNNRGILAKLKELTNIPLYFMHADGTRTRF